MREMTAMEFRQRRDKRIAQAVRRGESIPAIATQFGVSTTSVDTISSHFNDSLGKRQRLSSLSINAYRIIALLQQGHSQTKVAQLVHLTRSRVQQIATKCREHGVRLDDWEKKHTEAPTQREE